VSEQLVSDVPIGLWLSGGLDSSTILHYAAEAAHGPLKTFSVTFQGRSFDDGRYIREVSNFFGTQHHEIDLNPTVELSDAIEEIAYYSDEPSGDAGALPLWFLARMTRKEVTVALSGEGADELFGGYLTYKGDRYRRLTEEIPLFIKRTALACALKVPVSDDKIGFEYKLKRFLRGTLLSSEEAHIFWNGTFSEDEKQNIFRLADPKALAGILRTMKRAPGLERYLEFDQRFYLPDDILYKVDRMSMAHALEVRPPFLDSRIVDFAAKLPDSMKIRGRVSKYILRRLMKSRLPTNVLSRPKIGLDIPIHDWFRGPLRVLLLDTISEDAVRQTGLFHWPPIKGMIDAHLSRKANVGYHLWGLMTLLIWMRRWDIQSPGQQRAQQRHALIGEDELSWLPS
jgi:asparagine synthase (glutamine-hydrolysing)